MSKSKSKPSASSELPELSDAVDQLSEEVRILRGAIDELRDDVVWAARQVLGAGYDVVPGQTPQRQLDPLAPGEWEHANDRGVSPESGGEYCCDRPRLVWHGDPQAPGIACENCGYIVADEGSLLIWNDSSTAKTEADGAPSTSVDTQSRLFD